MFRRLTYVLATLLASLLPLVTPSPLAAQRASLLRAGVVRVPSDTTAPERNPLAPPPADRFQVAATYIWLSAAFGATAGGVAFSSHDCSDCGYAGAVLGSIIGTGVGEKLARSALRCERWGFTGRTALASLLAGGTALMIGKANARAGQWTAIVGTPLASSYLVGGCTPK